MRRLTAFGERIASSDPDRHAAESHAPESHARTALIDRFSAWGRAGITRAA